MAADSRSWTGQKQYACMCVGAAFCKAVCVTWLLRLQLYSVFLLILSVRVYPYVPLQAYSCMNTGMHARNLFMCGSQCWNAKSCIFSNSVVQIQDSCFFRNTTLYYLMLPGHCISGQIFGFPSLKPSCISLRTHPHKTEDRLFLYCKTWYISVN